MLVTVVTTLSITVRGAQVVRTDGAVALNPRSPPLSPLSRNALLAGTVMLGPAGTVIVTVSGEGWKMGAMLPGIVTVIPGTVTVAPGLVTVTVVVTIGTCDSVLELAIGLVAMVRGHEQPVFPMPSSSSWPWS